MQALTVRLERIFDVQRHGAGEAPPHVYFSCVADGQLHYSVRLTGTPRLQAGDRVTVVLRHPGNWQSLVGWKNHANGEVLLNGTGSRLGLAASAVMAGTAGMSWWRATPSDSRFLSGVGLVLSALMLIFFAVSWRDDIRAARLLDEA